jgi:hypothetical protein
MAKTKEKTANQNNKPRPLTPKQEKIISLKTQNPDATGTEIARLADADVSYTIEILQRYGLARETIADYRKHKIDILTGLQHRLLSNISQADIQKEPIRNRIVAAGILHDKEMELTGGKREVQPMINIVQVKVEQRPDQDQIVTLESNQLTSSTIVENTTTNDISNLDT